jgi:hypothetical protein
MARYLIHSKGILIGSSLLEFGDPPMAVAFGQFTPLPAYKGIPELLTYPSGSEC